jgi:hypothetical protein
MQQSLGLSDYFIVAFVGLVFVGGAIVVFKFMRGKN